MDAEGMCDVQAENYGITMQATAAREATMYYATVRHHQHDHMHAAPTDARRPCLW
jgi:hypothetical protein